MKTGKVEGKEQRYFLVRIISDGDDINLEEYAGLLRAVRSTIKRSGGQLETLRNDISFYYSKKSYPLIHQVENLMRKLITYFMLTNVGKEWVTETLPNPVKEALEKSKRKQYVDVLHQIDFNHLGDFLFKTYQTKNISDLYEKLEQAQSAEDLDLEELKGYKGRSNWERYFSKVVECSDDYLRKRWEELYELRCSVAHNSIISKTEYERIETLVKEVGEFLQKAVDNLDKIHVPTKEKEQLAESVASNINTRYQDFIQAWRSFNDFLANMTVDLKLPTATSPIEALQTLSENEFIDDELVDEGLELISFRNQLVHDARAVFTEQEITNYIQRIEAFKRALSPSWKDEVINALETLGGEASLTDIYDYIENNSLRKLPNTWKSSVRKTLQVYSSDMGAYKGGEDLFQHLDKGAWALRHLNYKNK